MFTEKGSPMTYDAARAAGHAHVTRDAFGLARIGRTPADLMGIRHVDGEGGNAPAAGSNPAPDAGTGTGGGGGTDPSSGGGTGAPANDDGDTGGTGSVKFEDLDPRTQSEIKKLRDEAARYRAEKSAAVQRATEAESKKDAVLAALGLKPDGSAADPDPAELQGRLEATTHETAATKRENLVLRAAPALGADADRLLDKVSFRAKLDALGVDDRAAVETLIRETLEQDSSLKSAPAPARSSGGTTHTGNTPSGQRKSLQAALAERYGSGTRAG